MSKLRENTTKWYIFQETLGKPLSEQCWLIWYNCVLSAENQTLSC